MFPVFQIEGVSALRAHLYYPTEDSPASMKAIWPYSHGERSVEWAEYNAEVTVQSKARVITGADHVTKQLKSF